MVLMTSQIKQVFLKKDVAPINVWLLQKQKRLIHNITAGGTYHLDGYEIKAINLNLNGIFTSGTTLVRSIDSHGTLASLMLKLEGIVCQ